MRRSYILKLAIKNLLGHRLRSVLTITGITIGVGFIVFLISMAYGLQRISNQEIANLEALQIIDITPGKSKIVKVNDETLEKFRGIPNVDKVAPQAEMVATFSFNTSTVEGVAYGRGNDFLEMESTDIASGRVYGESKNEVLINKTAARQLGFSETEKILDKTIEIDLKLGPDFLGEDATNTEISESFVVVGVIENEESPYVYLSLNKLQKEGLINYSSAKLRVTDKDYTDSVKQQVENLGYKTVALKDTVDQINKFFSIFQIVLLAFGSIAVLVAALGMFNTLTISLLEKTREISFMKILGTPSKDIWKLFITESLIIGAVGGIFGIILGMGLGGILNQFITGVAYATGNRPVKIFYTPASFVLIIFFAAILVSYLTGIYPSRRASRIDPLESIRYE